MSLTAQEFIDNLDYDYSIVENSNVISDSGASVNGDDLHEFMFTEIDSNEKTLADVFKVENVSGYIDKMVGVK